MKHRVLNRLNEYVNMVFKDGLHLIKQGGASLILFELIYKLLFTAIFYPVLVITVNFTLKKAGFKYLTNNFLYTYLRSPYTIAAIVLAFMIIAFYVTYEVACLSVCFDMAYHGRKMSVGQIFKSGLRLMRISIRKKRIVSVIHISLISIMMNITILGFFLSNIKLNSDMVKILMSGKITRIIAGILCAAVFIYCFIHFFTINFITCDGSGISEGKHKSRLLMKQRGIGTFFVILGWNLIVLVTIYIVYFLIALLIIAGVLILDRVNVGMAIYISVFRVAVTIIKLIIPIMSTPVSFAVISGLFYRYRCDSGKDTNLGMVSREISPKKKSHRGKSGILSIIMAAVLLGINITYLVKAFDSNPFYNVEIFSNTLTMAHRGCSYDTPENTMLAFEKAVASTADYIELDVHETKDGEIVVIHDSSLKRTTGIDRKVYDMTYDEIKELDAGSYFGDEEEFKNCHIPLLEDVMKYTKGKIKLNIEIKLSDREPRLVEKVAGLVEKYDYIDDCYVTSMNYAALTRIKEINDQIKTGYVLMTAYGNFYNIENVDAFSVNMAYVNKNIVDAIHYRGKKIFVWTINSKKDAEKYVSMGVDAVITDDPAMAKKAAYAKYSNPLIENVLSFVFTD